MRENTDMKLRGRLGLYMRWPKLMIFPLVLMDIWVYLTDKKASLVMTMFLLGYIVLVLMMDYQNKTRIMVDLVEFASQFGIVQNTLLKDLAVPYALLQDDGKILWMNDEFKAIFGEAYQVNTYLSHYMPELNRSVFPKAENEFAELDFDYDVQSFHAHLRCVSIHDFSNSETLLDLPAGREHFVAVHLQDTTQLNQAVRENQRQKVVAGLIHIDNYDEMIDTVEEVRQSLLVALIDRKINAYISEQSGIVKKTEKDKYFVVMKQETYEKMKEDKFSLLEDVKSISVSHSIAPSLSIGLGLGSDSYAVCQAHARAAINLALARGGDQVVVKNGKELTYFGGKREQTAKNTRVKARVKAEALRELMNTKDRVLVMGHKLSDVDSLGAALGIYRAATSLGKKCNIVLNEISVTLRPLYDAFNENPDYPSELFVNSVEAEDLLTDNTMVIVVDTNKPKMTECERLLKRGRAIAVLDHHRQSDEVIENAVLSYIEPYASSACEMVAEVLQYFEDDLKPSSLEASSMYAGIMVDTNNFSLRTGVRTFEAAAYLRRAGADITYVKKLLRDDMAAYKAKSKMISEAEVYRKVFAIARGANLGIQSPTIAGAQAANDLLNIVEVKASFALTEYNGKIFVSARSIDEVNVQRIMENLGGGGHINAAGCQFSHTNMNEAVATLKHEIDKMIEEGDI